MPEGLEEVTDGLDVRAMIVESGDDGRTGRDGQIRELRHQGLEILQDEVVGHAGVLFVHLGIHVLDVEQHIVEVLGRLTHHIGGDETTGLDAGLHTALTGQAQQVEGKFALQQGLAAGDGHAATGASIKHGIFLRNLEGLGHGVGLAVDDDPLGRTGFGTGHVLAAHAFAAVDGHETVLATGQGAVGAGLEAAGALVRPQAAALVVGQLRFPVLGFRVAAPAAAQTAALGEDDGTDAGTIMHGIFLDIEDEAARVVVFDHGVTAGDVEG